MKKIIAAIDFTLYGKKYKKGKEVKVQNKEDLIKLNERGFIEPFSFTEIQDFKEKEIKNEKEEN